nr:putative zinc finger, CCHC-type [Tanacetum cinerariifolium]
MYLFLINEKSESLDMFKNFKAKVENQLERKIKVVRSDRGDEYYGRHTDVGQACGYFFDFCKDHGIINQYTMSGTPKQNGVAERRNRTIMDMVRSMKPSLRYLRVWGCPAEAKLYNPQSRKLNLKTISCFFIGYPEQSKGYRFYCPSHNTRIVETRHAEFLETANNSGSGSFRRIKLQEGQDETPIIHVPIPISTPFDTSNDHLIEQDHPNNVKENEPNPERSHRNRQPTNFDDYYTYLNEANFDLGKCNDPESFEDAITCDQSAHWREAMEDELNSISKNNVCELAELPKGAKPVGCKWVYKTKLDPNGNVKRYKACLVAKGYTQKEGVDYKETFSPVSRKDSLRIVVALVAHFDLELHQMDVKMAFLNGDLHEDVYIAQPQGFKSKSQEHLVCKLKKSFYGFKQASRQWYLKFDEVIKKHNFIKNQVDHCVYLKMSGSNFIILVLYVDDILLASNNIDLLHESQRFLSRNFDMKDLGEASYVIGIEIHQDRANGILGLSQKAYIEHILNRFNMKHCSPTVAPVIEGDVFGSYQCLKTEVEYEEIWRIPYASVVGNLTYAQVCTQPDIAYTCGTKEYKLTYTRSDNLEVIGYSDLDFAKCKDTS